MAVTLYRQCVLRKAQDSAVAFRVLWGQTPYAEVGRRVKVQEDDGTWTHGWEVVSVHGEPVSEQYIVRQRHAHTRQRRASDI
jgi:hypothetical protein